MSAELTRRHFIGTAVAATAVSAAVSGDKALPTRKFGRTGLTPSILAIGCGNRLYMAYDKIDRGAEAVTLALDNGITYLDTAQAYGDGKSETMVGQAIKGRRNGLVIATKTPARTADELMRRLEDSLKRLQTDHVDVLHIHSLKFEDDLKAIEAKGGALEALYKVREQKMAHFVGITSHTDPKTLATALDRHDFDCTQMALNAGQQGRSPDGGGFWKKDPNDMFSEPIPHKPDPESFEKVALPVAVRKNLGIIAMKITGQESLIGRGTGKAEATELIRYALSLPVSLATIGMPKLEYIRTNTAFARSFTPMPAPQMQEFTNRISDANKVALDRYFARHEDV